MSLYIVKYRPTLKQELRETPKNSPDASE